MGVPQILAGGEVAAFVRRHRPDHPVFFRRPQAATAAVRAFHAAFADMRAARIRVLYAVKCNPDPVLLAAMRAAGLEGFDVASLREVELVRETAPGAFAAFMNPVKSRLEIRRAHELGVRHFSFDHADELAKLIEETDGDRQVVAVVRLLVRGDGAGYSLGDKYGATIADAAALLGAARAAGLRTGLTFHVGSQNLDPEAYARALAATGEVMRLAPGPLAVLDLGGGFPVPYVGIEPPPLGAYVAAINRALAALPIARAIERGATELWCEPGRALAAATGSLLARVTLRRGARLHLNDGVFGTLADLKLDTTIFPMRRLTAAGAPDETVAGEGPLMRFSLYGPTCDPMDSTAPIFLLPADIREGEWIEVGQTGAYATSTASRFNGFGEVETVDTADAPLMPRPLPALAMAAE